MPLSTVVLDLFQAMDRCVPAALYPQNVIPISERIEGTAFFPGGSGLYLEGREMARVQFPVADVMVLGHNFDSEAGYRDSFLRGREKLDTGTWGNLLTMLTSAGVPLDRCFFTNAFMGVCKGSDSLKYEGQKDPEFTLACAALLKKQIAAQRPRLIVALGLHVPPMLARLSPDLHYWRSPTLKLQDLDVNPLVTASFEVEQADVHTAVVVPIAHPCLPNARLRKPVGFPQGKDGEIELIKAGRDRCIDTAWNHENTMAGS